jgi:hypothetical protein
MGAAESDEPEKEEVVVDKLDNVDTDLPLPTLPLVTRAGTDDKELELLTDLDPSLNRRRGGRSISARVGLGTSILLVGNRIG